jgi:molybdopterin/thiamine biosynthesis adenylyltransferase
MGTLPGIAGTLQANEAIKLVLGVGELLVGRLLTFDASSVEFREITVPRDPACPACGEGAA